MQTVPTAGIRPPRSRDVQETGAFREIYRGLNASTRETGKKFGISARSLQLIKFGSPIALDYSYRDSGTFGVGDMGFKIWGITILALIGSSQAFAKSKWMVESKHLRSYERAKDCSVFKSVAWHALEDQRRRERNAQKIESLVKERRTALEKCGAERGLPLSKSET